MPAHSFTLPAHAKINLGLRVLGRRGDGYHEVETVLQTITLHDELTFTKLDGGRFELACDDPTVPRDQSNLVWRAADALREKFDLWGMGAHVKLSKRVPTQAGLGGGSSDAAIALVGLAKLWDLDTNAIRADLIELAARLGSDVPFFLTGGTALATGRGEHITSLNDVPRTHLLVVVPPVGVPTAEAYRGLNSPALTSVVGAVKLPISHEGVVALCEAWGNSFEPSVFRLRPEVGRVKEAVLRAGASAALMSGSGSSVFGVFDSEAKAAVARESLRRVDESWRVFACETLPRGYYARSYAERGAPLPGAD